MENADSRKFGVCQCVALLQEASKFNRSLLGSHIEGTSNSFVCSAIDLNVS